MGGDGTTIAVDICGMWGSAAHLHQLLTFGVTNFMQTWQSTVDLCALSANDTSSDHALLHGACGHDGRATKTDGGVGSRSRPAGTLVTLL